MTGREADTAPPAPPAPPRVLRSRPGRSRIEVPGLAGPQARQLASRLEAASGISRATANGRTSNLLVEFDPGQIDESEILRRLPDLVASVWNRHAPPAPAQPVSGRHIPIRPAGTIRARVAVRGLDRDPDLARRLVEHLGTRPGILRVHPSPLTGRVLIEIEEGTETIQGILDQIAGLEPPEAEEGEGVAGHPLDPGPIGGAGTRTLGAALGLVLLTVRRALGDAAPVVAGAGPGEVAGGVSLIEGLPPLARRIERALGHRRKEVGFALAAIAGMTASGNALGLAFAGATGLRAFTEMRARRRSWEEYEHRLREPSPIHPGALLTLSPGQRAPLAAAVRAGCGVCAGRDGEPVALSPGATMDAGAPLRGGVVTVALIGGVPFAPQPPPAPAQVPLVERYGRAVALAALLYAAATGIVTRSPVRALTGLLLVNPIPALAGRESADRGASARVIRSGVTNPGSRRDRPIRRTDVLVVDEVRTLCDGWEFSRVLKLAEGISEEDLLSAANSVFAAAGSPWGVTLPAPADPGARDGSFDGRVAAATIAGERWRVEPADVSGLSAEPAEPDEHVLAARRSDGEPAGLVALRPHLTRGVAPLVQACKDADVRLEVATRSLSPRVRHIAQRAGVEAVRSAADRRVAHLRDEGWTVAVVSDSARAGAAFDRCNLAIGLSSGQSGPFPVRADLLAPRLEAVAAIVRAGSARDAAVRDAVLISLAGNVAGAAWGAVAAPPFRHGMRAGHIAGLLALVDAAARLWGGGRARTVTERLSDPQPERWGRRSVSEVLSDLDTTGDGLTTATARQRWRPRPEPQDQQGLMPMVLKQIRSPVVAILGVGAALSMAIGMVSDVVMIGAVVAANAAVGAWQEGRAGAATTALHELSAGTARVVRDGIQTMLSQDALVPGDVIVVASGDRVPADARIISEEALEVDEAALTGESMPVAKSAANGSAHGRILLEGTDVVSGTGRAVVVAVGQDTRMGATAAALAQSPDTQSPLDERLGRLLLRGLPWVAAGGAMVTAAGLLWGRSPIAQVALGVSVAVAVVPEGLPLMAGVAEAAVALRLAKRQALVTRLSAVEALGRVDVACVDKTGTLTRGSPALTLVADGVSAEAPPGELGPRLCEVLRAAAVASAAPDAPDAASHPTDVAVVAGAREAGLGGELNEREAESPFDPARGFHATQARGRVCLKGAVEVLAERCVRVRTERGTRPLGPVARARLLERAESLAEQGLRVLLVAEGPRQASLLDPAGLTALGFIGISDPLRAGAATAVARCRGAGVRVVMLTGDHPATARATARQAGLPAEDGRIMTGDEVEALGDDELAERLERTTIVARTMPLQKVRIIESLRSRGHVVAMTGDGVNDAPALRLADVGVAMGRGGTEVARRAADLVLVDDEFSTLAEALVEGRAFWHNMRRSLGLLLGGNAGEVILMIAAAVTGRLSPLTTRQVLTVNLVTDVLPAVSVAVQPPEHRNLTELAREGGTALDAPLRADIVRRGIATGVPSFGAYVLASRLIGLGAGRSVAYLSIVTTQLAQTVDLGYTEGRLTASVLGAVAGSLGVVALTLAVPGLRGALDLAPVTAPGLMLAATASLLAVVLGRTLPVERVLG